MIVFQLLKGIILVGATANARNLYKCKCVVNLGLLFWRKNNSRLSFKLIYYPCHLFLCRTKIQGNILVGPIRVIEGNHIGFCPYQLNLNLCIFHQQLKEFAIAMRYHKRRNIGCNIVRSSHYKWPIISVYDNDRQCARLLCSKNLFIKPAITPVYQGNVTLQLIGILQVTTTISRLHSDHFSSNRPIPGQVGCKRSLPHVQQAIKSTRNQNLHPIDRASSARQYIQHNIVVYAGQTKTTILRKAFQFQIRLQAGNFGAVLI